VTERRYDPVTGEWRMFAGDRQDRTFLPPDEFCPLCPTVPGGPATEIPLPGFEVAVFENRFPALLRVPPAPTVRGTGLHPVATSAGANEVIVYSDRHDLGLAGMDVGGIARIVDVWADRYAELGARAEVGYVFIFENRGVAVGVTLDHPHGQIYAYPEIPPRVAGKLEVAARHYDRGGTCVHCDVIAAELAEDVRVVARNRGFLAFVPFAARFPFEVEVAPVRHSQSLLDLTHPERLDLADILRSVLRGFDRLFGFPLPYVMSMHQEPTDGGSYRHLSHFHIEFTPLHRRRDRLKYIAGSELGAGAFVNDTAPEDTALLLRLAVTSASVPPRNAA